MATHAQMKALEEALGEEKAAAILEYLEARDAARDRPAIVQPVVARDARDNTPELRTAIRGAAHDVVFWLTVMLCVQTSIIALLIKYL